MTDCLIHSNYRPPRQARIRLEGEFDLAAREELLAAFAAPALRSCAVVRVDASQVSFADCSSLQVIDQARQHIEAGGGRLVVVAESHSFALVARVADFPRLRCVDPGFRPGSSARRRTPGRSARPRRPR